ncbi:MAG: SPOR domain-containing protein, partial [Rhodospirillales bacterium]
VFKGEAVCKDNVDQGVQVADVSGKPIVAIAAKTPAHEGVFDALSVDDLPAAAARSAPQSVAAENEKALPVKRASTMELAILEMEAHRLANIATAAGAPDKTKSPSRPGAIEPTAVKRSTLATAPGRPIPLPGIEQAPKRTQVSQGEIHIADAEGGSGLMSRPLPPPAPVSIERVNKTERLLPRRPAPSAAAKTVAPVETVKAVEKPIVRKVSEKTVTPEKPATFEPVVEFETPKPSAAEKPKRALRKAPAPARQKRAPAVHEATARPGLYYVLGSFSVAANAKRMARKAAGLHPKIVAASPKGKRVLRVLVGPFSKERQNRIKAEIRAANVRGFWILHMKTATKIERLTGAQLAALSR